MTHPALVEITERIKDRSKDSRKKYEDRIQIMRDHGRARPRLSCGSWRRDEGLRPTRGFKISLIFAGEYLLKRG